MMYLLICNLLEFEKKNEKTKKKQNCKNPKTEILVEL